jgi:uncharacterized protein YjiK
VIDVDVLRTRRLPMRGASAVVAVPGGWLLVEDDEGVYRYRSARASLWAGPAEHPDLGDLEGLAADEDGRVVWALSEESGAVIELPFGDGPPRPRLRGYLPRPGHRHNKGYEGLAFMPSRHSPTGRASLVAVHEAKPRRVAIFELPTLAQTHDLKLPRDAKAVLDDLADVTVDPVTGALVVLSQESRRLAVLTLDGQALRLQAVFELVLEKKARPEGITFSKPSRLAVVTEGPAMLVEYRVLRGPRPSR